MTPGSTDRTRIRRVPENAVFDTETLYQILDAGNVVHVSVITDGQPFVIPVGYGRRGNQLILHGSSASRFFRTLAAGQSTCATVTLLDGLVLARSTFHSSMNYRSVMVLGTPRQLSGDDEVDALRVLTEHLVPGRWADARPPKPQELRATITLALDLDECSIKVDQGFPEDDAEDYVEEPWSKVWAGIVPLRTVSDPPIPDDQTRAAEIPLPDYLAT
jgi:nitroimidazol reductase NimA-like FMN-containing flavoprotein (pyridoxamine 5'-phosphate oxidase superfamily)